MLEDLAERLGRTRWPLDSDNEDWRYGTERAYLEELVAYWLDEYDWREHERAMNAFAHSGARSTACRSTSSTSAARARTRCR